LQLDPFNLLIQFTQSHKIGRLKRTLEERFGKHHHHHPIVVWTTNDCERLLRELE
jgi:hypothetical protein